MFPPTRTRTRAAFLRVMDRAIEFATLGEYGLEVPGADAPTAPGSGRIAHSGARRPGAVASHGGPPRRVPAATPAGRHAAAGELVRVVVVPHPLFRHRGGEVHALPKPCLVDLSARLSG
jgi:hypothetical protein